MHKYFLIFILLLIMGCSTNQITVTKDTPVDTAVQEDVVEIENSEQAIENTDNVVDGLDDIATDLKDLENLVN